MKENIGTNLDSNQKTDETIYTYDDLGRMTEKVSTTVYGEDIGMTATSTCTYDDFGNVNSFYVGLNSFSNKTIGEFDNKMNPFYKAFSKAYAVINIEGTSIREASMNNPISDSTYAEGIEYQYSTEGKVLKANFAYVSGSSEFRYTETYTYIAN